MGLVDSVRDNENAKENLVDLKPRKINPKSTGKKDKTERSFDDVILTLRHSGLYL
jgi:hypothetical protein